MKNICYAYRSQFLQLTLIYNLWIKVHSLYSSVYYILSGHTGSALVWHTQGRAFSFRIVASIYTVPYVEPGSTALCRVGVTASQLDLPSLTPLSVAGCG